MRELNWGWPEITCILINRLAPTGMVITRKDLGALPQDRVLKEWRREDGTAIEYSWISLAEAERIRPKILKHTGEKMGVMQVSGRWQKCASVILWKLARDGITLKPSDRDALPAGKILKMHGHAQDLELLWVNRDEARRIAAWELDNEGKKIVENV